MKLNAKGAKRVDFLRFEVNFSVFLRHQSTPTCVQQL